MLDFWNAKLKLEPEVVSTAVANWVKCLNEVLRSFIVHNYVHHNRSVMMAMDSKRVLLKHLQNIG